MNRIWLGALLAVVFAGADVRPVDAAYCGLASYQHGKAAVNTVSFARARQACSRCEPSCAAPAACGTRMVKDVVYEQK